MSPHPRNTATLLTPPGTSAIAVIRLRGPDVPDFLNRHLSRSPKLHRCVHADLCENDQAIDDVLVVLTDPTTADLNVHGGQWVIESVLDLAGREGFELTNSTGLPLSLEATDYTTILDQEIDAYLPMAKTELGVRTILAQRTQWEGFFARARAEPFLLADELPRILSDRTLVHLLYPPTVAIIGPANVGKSTLANQLFSQERSITADVPGTTRDWVGEIANIDGLPVLLLDTPGLRHTHDPVEAAAIHRSRDQIFRAALTVLVLDATRPLAGEQSTLLASFPNPLLVINKSDHPPARDMIQLPAIHTIATTGQGLGELRAAITVHFCGEPTINPHRPRIWTDRQRSILQRALDDPAALHALYSSRNL